MVDSWLRALQQAGQVFAQPAVDEDEAAQARLREQYPADPLFGDSGTGRDYREQPVTAEEQASARRAFASFIFGPERGSIFGGEASRPERAVRDWVLSEQEFRTSAERFEEGSWRAGFGWGALGLAGVIPFAGDAAQAVGRLGRAVEAAGDVARAAETAGDIARISEVSPAVATVSEETTDFSRIFEGGRTVNPLTDSDGNIFSAASNDPIFQAVDTPPFRVSGDWRDTDVLSNPQEVLDSIEKNAGIVLPQGWRQEIIEKYGESFVGVDPEYAGRAYDVASEMLSDVENFGDWTRPYEVSGLSGTTRVESVYSPSSGIPEDAQKQLWGAGEYYHSWILEPEAIATSLQTRARTYAEVHNRIVSDQIYNDLARLGVEIPASRGGQRFNVADWSNGAAALSEFGARATVAVPGKVVQQVLDQGGIFNQYVTMRSRGMLSPSTRVNAELSVMGIAPRVGPFGRPVYGYLTIADDVKTDFVASLSPVMRRSLDYGKAVEVGQPRGYGDVHFVFGNQTLQNSTFTWGDSLLSPVIARPAVNPTAGDIGLVSGPYLESGPRGTAAAPDVGSPAFIEAQITMPQLQDVTEIHVLDGLYARTDYIDNLRNAMRTLTGRDVDIYVREPAPIGLDPQGYTVMGYRSRLTYPGGRQVENPLRGDLPDWGKR